MNQWRLTPNGEYWTAQRTVNGKNIRRGLGARKSAARPDGLSELAARRRVNKLNDALASDLPHLDGPTLADAWRGFIAERGDAWCYKRRLMYEATRDRMAARFGSARRVGQLDRAGLGEWKVQLLDEGLAPTTVSGQLSRARSMLEWCVDCEFITRNPCRRLTIAKSVRGGRTPTDDEVRALLAETAGQHELHKLVALCALAGLRRGEALALTWAGVRADRLIVPQPKTAKATGRGERAVRLEPDLAEILAGGRGVYERHLRVVDVYADTATRRAKRAMKRAGVDWPKPFQGLRKWRATTWRRHFPEHVVDAWLGHGPDVARRHYVEVEEAYFG